jgi:hypothetical protein
MVVNSVLPNLLNVAQIVNIITGPVNGQPKTLESASSNFMMEYPPEGGHATGHLRQQIHLVQPSAESILYQKGK